MVSARRTLDRSSGNAVDHSKDGRRRNINLDSSS
jgi:hypothetical protein